MCPDTVRLLTAGIQGQELNYISNNTLAKLTAHTTIHENGQLTLRNHEIFEGEDSNIFSATGSPRVAHMFSLEEHKLEGQDVFSQSQTLIHKKK